MIGRFAKPGVYRELLSQREFKISAAAGVLALGSFLVDFNRPDPGVVGTSLAVAALLLNGLPIVWGALQGLWSRRVNVDELVSLAIIASVIQGEFLTAAVVSFVMTLGSLIEQATSASARKAIASLVNLSPHQAVVIVNGEPVTVPVDKVRVGDRLLIRPGDRIPVDALVADGISAVDESSMTGEPLPREKHPGDIILAGTLNHNGVLEADVLRVGEDTTLGRLVSLIEDAENHRPQVVRLIDRYAAWFTPTILACAGFTWLLTGDPHRAVAVMIVGCPCALILAAPTATVAALGRAARKGILVKGGPVLEKAAAVDAVFFDKTGTLTIGEPRVEEITCGLGEEKESVLSLAASAEENCNHPLGRAVLKAAQYSRVALRKADEVLSEIGLGVRARVAGALVEVGGVSYGGGLAALPPVLRTSAENLLERGRTPLVVYRDRTPIGLLGVTDRTRPTAAALIQNLGKLGIKRMAVISGDQEQAVRELAQGIGVPEYHAERKPQEKLDIIRQAQARGMKVMYVGDGINDGPSLAAADVGVAMGAGGADVALETSDLALVHDDIAKLPFLIGLGRRMLAIIKINIAFGLIFNGLAVLASGAGVLSPIMAAVTHNVGSVLVVIASASLALYRES